MNTESLPFETHVVHIHETNLYYVPSYHISKYLYSLIISSQNIPSKRFIKSPYMPPGMLASVSPGSIAMIILFLKLSIPFNQFI